MLLAPGIHPLGIQDPRRANVVLLQNIAIYFSSGFTQNPPKTNQTKSKGDSKISLFTMYYIKIFCQILKLK